MVTGPQTNPPTALRKSSILPSPLSVRKIQPLLQNIHKGRLVRIYRSCFLFLSIETDKTLCDNLENKKTSSLILSLLNGIKTKFECTILKYNEELSYKMQNCFMVHDKKFFFMTFCYKTKHHTFLAKKVKKDVVFF
jgi:hypothetical protein